MTYFQMLCDRLEGIEKTLGTKKSDAAAKKLEQKKKIFDELIETEVTNNFYFLLFFQKITIKKKEILCSEFRFTL